MAESREQFRERIAAIKRDASNRYESDHPGPAIYLEDGTPNAEANAKWVLDWDAAEAEAVYAAALRDVSRVFVERPMTFGVDAYCDAQAIKVIDTLAASLGIDLDDAP